MLRMTPIAISCICFIIWVMSWLSSCSFCIFICASRKGFISAGALDSMSVWVADSWPIPLIAPLAIPVRDDMVILLSPAWGGVELGLATCSLQMDYRTAPSGVFCGFSGSFPRPRREPPFGGPGEAGSNHQVEQLGSAADVADDAHRHLVHLLHHLGDELVDLLLLLHLHLRLEEGLHLGGGLGQHVRLGRGQLAHTAHRTVGNSSKRRHGDSPRTHLGVEQGGTNNLQPDYRPMRSGVSC